MWYVETLTARGTDRLMLPSAFGYFRLCVVGATEVGNCLYLIIVDCTLLLVRLLCNTSGSLVTLRHCSMNFEYLKPMYRTA